MLNKCQKLYLPVKQIPLKIPHFKTSLFARYEIWRSEATIPEKKFVVKQEESVLTIKKDFIFRGWQAFRMQCVQKSKQGFLPRFSPTVMLHFETTK